MPTAYRLAADAVVVLHAAYVLFVFFGLVAVLAGIVRRWHWVRNPWFRGVHLAAIGVVVAEAWCGITCPLTTLEKHLRQQGGQAAYAGDFVGRWTHELLFVELPPGALTAAYSLFGLLVLATFVLAPPRRKQVADSR